jgi:glutamate synthase (NADPH/NADH) large chain
MGFRTLDEMIGQMQMLDQRALVEHWKARASISRNCSPSRRRPEGVAIYHSEVQDP